MTSKIMKLKFISFLLFMSVAGTAIAADAPRQISIAVFDFGSPYHVRLRNDIGLVTSLLTANLTSNGQFTLIDRTELKKIMKEQSLGLSGEISPDTAAKIGRLVGAKILVTGQIFSVGEAVGTDVPDESSESHILVVVKIIGTETGRFFSQREQGLRKDLVALSDGLSKKIAETINNQYTNLVAAEAVSSSERIAHIVESIKGTNRPSVSVDFHSPHGTTVPIPTANNEMGIILQKAGFVVVDANSERKADIEISGIADSDMGPRQDDMYPVRTVVEAKAQERRSGKIIAIDREIADAVDIGKMTAQRSSQARAVDAVAEKILPLLAQ
jgi:hypothetical protein